MLWFSLFIVSLVMLAGWFWQVRTENAGIVDVLWAFSLSFLAFFHLLFSDGYWPLALMASAIMMFRYLRLGLHLGQRVLGEEEDGRYRYLRQYWGKKANLYHFFFFQFQALLAWGFALPVWLICQGQLDGLGLPQILGLLVAIVAISGVIIADKQLANFKADPANKGEVCETGLWNYSRHPNYFFEWLHWFSYPLMAIGIAHGGWLWLAPVIMLLFLYFVTGIPYTEQQAIRSRGDKYRRYQQTTSAFIPWRKKT